MKIHSCWNTTLGDRDPIFACRACPFVGNLDQAIWHSLRNQFEVKPTRDDRNIKLGSAQDSEKHSRELRAPRSDRARPRKSNSFSRDDRSRFNNR